MAELAEPEVIDAALSEDKAAPQPEGAAHMDGAINALVRLPAARRRHQPDRLSHRLL